jgi:hypothetical protein
MALRTQTHTIGDCVCVCVCVCVCACVCVCVCVCRGFSGKSSWVEFSRVFTWDKHVHMHKQDLFDLDELAFSFLHCVNAHMKGSMGWTETER